MPHDLDSLLTEFAAAPGQLQETVGDLSDDHGDEVPIAGKWSVRQVICHLADFEVVYAERIRRVLAEDNPTIFGGNPEVFARALQYRHRCMADELRLIAAVRRSTVHILRHCDLEDFQRTGVHSEDGPMTLETLIERCTAHIPHHQTFLEEKLTVLRQL